MSRFFRPSEFRCPCCNIAIMDIHFLDMLDAARGIADVPFVINSGWRCPAHNQEIGGKLNSSHLDGKAVDIQAITGKHRLDVLRGLIKAGFTRIGIATTFIHADSDADKPQSIWMY